jgi:hypothetical protein
VINHQKANIQQFEAKAITFNESFFSQRSKIKSIVFWKPNTMAPALHPTQISHKDPRGHRLVHNSGRVFGMKFSKLTSDQDI